MFFNRHVFIREDTRSTELIELINRTNLSLYLRQRKKIHNSFSLYYSPIHVYALTFIRHACASLNFSTFWNYMLLLNKVHFQQFMHAFVWPTIIINDTNYIMTSWEIQILHISNIHKLKMTLLLESVFTSSWRLRTGLPIDTSKTRI